ncbi:PREDICTED: uncharacterized protein LOC101304335 [Fragaria vesca subsp. vesca]|uniref:uncharacterized protein LOC101304335 n=1 Tax=Fragaria vesca subsp. vesca TaxID=101020 RepID=UPI0002C35B8D|nr:PREDICTED: uncharacterized protein LOC101304335 [Fragaria vesca subsp. vesca]
MEICDGPLVGEMVVEDVEIDCGGEVSKREVWSGIGQVECKLDDSDLVLVHPYLVPMAATFSLAAPYIEGSICSGVRPNALCLGVGGGALLGFVRTQFGFQVVGVEAYEEALRVSWRYFGLEDGEHILDKFVDACQVEEGCDVGSGNDVDTEFDVIMVDLDSSDGREFVRKNVLFLSQINSL